MTFLDFIDAVAKSTKQPKARVRQFCAAYDEALARALEQDGNIVLPGVGSYRVAKRSGRTIRHVKTRELVVVPEKVEVRFRVTEKFRARLVSGGLIR